MLHIVPKKSRPGARVRHALRPSETTVSRGSVCPLPWPPGPQCWRDAGVGVTHPARAAGRRLLPPSAVVAGWGIPGQQAASARALFPRRQHLRAVSGGTCLPCVCAPDSVSLPGLSTAPSRSAESVHGERLSRVTCSGDNTCHTSGQRGSLQVERSPRKDEGPTGLQPRGARRSQGRSPGHTPGRLAGLLALDPHGDCCPHGGLVPRKALPRIWSKLKKLLHLQTRDI